MKQLFLLGLLLVGGYLVTQAQATCADNLIVNGDLEQGPTFSGTRVIAYATGYSSPWWTSARPYWADLHTENSGYSGLTPRPWTGRYAGCWISTHDVRDITYREAIRGSLTQRLQKGQEQYSFEFDLTCITGTGLTSVYLYGLSTDRRLPLPEDRSRRVIWRNHYGEEMVFLGAFQVDPTQISLGKVRKRFIIDGRLLPDDGMTHFMIANSDRIYPSSPRGEAYLALDNFCMRKLCPEISNIEPHCTTDINSDGVPDYELTVRVEHDNPGSAIYFAPRMCAAAFSTDTLLLDGSSTYTITMLGSSCTGLQINYDSYVPDVLFPCPTKNYLLQVPDECPTGNHCVCDLGFDFNVSRGFLFSESCDYDVFYPTLLSDSCDQVTWYRDGYYVGTSLGTAPFQIPHRTAPYSMCMVVSRLAANGQRCEGQRCVQVSPSLTCGGGPGGPLGGGGPTPRLAVLPNPSTDYAQVQWSTRDVADRLDLRMYNSNGVVVQERLALNGHDGQTQVDLKDLPAGLYWLEIRGEGYRPEPFKLIKQ